VPRLRRVGAQRRPVWVAAVPSPCRVPRPVRAVLLNPLLRGGPASPRPAPLPPRCHSERSEESRRGRAVVFPFTHPSLGALRVLCGSRLLFFPFTPRSEFRPSTLLSSSLSLRAEGRAALARPRGSRRGAWSGGRTPRWKGIPLTPPHKKCGGPFEPPPHLPQYRFSRIRDYALRLRRTTTSLHFSRSLRRRDRPAGA
jgi:hypothetical protein